MTKITSIILILLYMVSFMTIFLTGKVAGYENFLQKMTQENGFFETLSVVFLLFISFVGVKTIVKKDMKNIFLKFVIISFSILTLIAAMEEMSWGQHLFHFQSSSFFELHNQQKETNLHNLIDGNIFSSIIYSGVYVVFVFIPLLVYLFQERISIIKSLFVFIPSLHIILIILYASSFQIYFYDDIGVIADFATLIAGLILFLITVSIKKLWTKSLAIHFLYVLISMSLFMNLHSIFNFFNMQYEIREMFVIFAFLLFCTRFSQKLK